MKWETLFFHAPTREGLIKILNECGAELIQIAEDKDLVTGQVVQVNAWAKRPKQDPLVPSQVSALNQWPLRGSPFPDPDTIDTPDSDDYRRGYKDGFQAHVQACESGEPDRAEEIAKEIEGDPFRGHD